MSIIVGLPSLYIRDGNYKTLINVGDNIKVCLFFEDFITKIDNKDKNYIKNTSYNKYEFVGKIIHIRKVYRPNIIVIKSEDLVLFAIVSDNHNFKVGDNVHGIGNINLDPYYWFETLLEFDSDLDIYSCYKIVKIQIVKYNLNVQKSNNNQVYVLRDEKEIFVEDINSIVDYYNDFSLDFILYLEKTTEFSKESIPYLSID